MKKLSVRHARRLIKRAQSGSFIRKRKSTLSAKGSVKTVEIWDGTSVEKAVFYGEPRRPPETLCFDVNTDPTLRFLANLRRNISSGKDAQQRKVSWIDRRGAGLPRVKSYYDFSNIGTFSTGPALVISALYERAKEAIGKVPPAIDFPNWSPQAFQTLYEIGFFEIIGHAPAEQIREVYVEKKDALYKVSKILTGRNADGLEEASNVLLELLKYLSVDPGTSEDLITDINSAVSEAMINVARHAYPDYFVSVSTDLCLRQWWMSAKADKGTNTLTIVIYDQGATIPGTLPRREWFYDTVGLAMKALVPNYELGSESGTIDHEFINYSMKKGKTQTNDAQRGLGLPQMQGLIDICPDGTLSILSRRGLYKYGKNIGVYKRALDCEIEGTLIEWELTLPRART